jgi:lipopolysaccharide transport system ATP-binding protein
MIRRFTGRQGSSKIVHALDDVSFEALSGQTLGVIGHNGAGKSTLLRLLCGVGRPNSGSIRRHGRTSGLLDLGTGFHPLMTGRENIRTACILNGLTLKQIQALQSEMIAFAELDDFIDEPVRTYSTGMYLRLAFAASIQLNPDILIIDEVLTVGDDSFRKKCLARLDRFRGAGKTLVIASHELDQIDAVCDQVLVLEEGKVAIIADPETAIKHYKELLWLRTEKRASHISNETLPAVAQPESGSRMGTQEVVITGVRLMDQNGKPAEIFTTGNPIHVELSYELTKTLSDFSITLGIFTENDVKCFESYLPSVKKSLGSFGDTGMIECGIPTSPLQAGRYYVNIGFYPLDHSFMYDYHWHMHSLHIAGQIPNLSGIVSVSPTWTLKS